MNPIKTHRRSAKLIATLSLLALAAVAVIWRAPEVAWMSR
jgi:hypothetical protein